MNTTNFLPSWLIIQILYCSLCTVLLSSSFVRSVSIISTSSNAANVTASSEEKATYTSDASMEDILSDSISFDLHVADRNDELHVNIINEDGFLICDGRVSSIQQHVPPINCVHDTKLLRNGENTLYITVFSTRRNSIILQTSRRFNYIKPVISSVDKKLLVRALKYGIGGTIATGSSVKLIQSLLSMMLMPSPRRDVKKPQPSRVDAKPPRPSRNDANTFEKSISEVSVTKSTNNRVDPRFNRPPSLSLMRPMKLFQSQPAKYGLALLCLLLLGTGNERPTVTSRVRTSPRRTRSTVRQQMKAYGRLSATTTNSPSHTHATSAPSRLKDSPATTVVAAKKPKSRGQLVRKLLTSGAIMSLQAVFVMLQKTGLVGPAKTVASKLSNYFVPLFK